MFAIKTRTNRILAVIIAALTIGLVATTSALVSASGPAGSDEVTRRPLQLPWAHYASPSGPAAKPPAPQGAPGAVAQLTPWQSGMLGAPAGPMAQSPFGAGWIGGDPFQHMRAMEQQMDQLMAQFGMRPMTGMPMTGMPMTGMPMTGMPGTMPANPQVSPGSPTAPQAAVPAAPVAQMGIDIEEQPQQYVVHVNAGDLIDNDVHVELHGRNLTISGQRHSEQQSTSPQGNAVQRQERVESFQRMVTLPGPVQEDEMNSRVENGVLEIVIPKALPGDQI